MCLGATGVGGGTVAPKVAPKNRWLPTHAREPPWARIVADGPAICSATRSNSTSANVDERPRTIVVVEAAATEQWQQAFDCERVLFLWRRSCPHCCPRNFLASPIDWRQAKNNLAIKCFGDRGGTSLRQVPTRQARLKTQRGNHVNHS